MLKVLKAGFYTSVQDSGRFYYRNKGVPVSGVMDEMSVFKVNSLLENEVSSAVLEITMTGPTLVFEEETYMALGGAKMSATLNNLPIQNYKVYQIQIGDILSFGKLEKGYRSYLGVKNGFISGSVLGSRSFYKPITRENRLKDNDVVPFAFNNLFEPKISEIKVDSFLDESKIEVSKGPEFDLLNDKQLEELFSKTFSVAHENNRMAYQIQELISPHQLSMLTSATLPGTVQLTPAGKLIVLMKDGQTTGGYPRVMQLTDKAICVLAQKKGGDVIKFKLV
ncbi:5-oxoprolinase subunit C family protein [Maribacter hydrothermalis]|uniref:Allophanate hydrolase n=1 Tax=Maribacter hydrothermalis TaxID=1836467 RepID=A0A1B7ZCY2_9FLAO|nr:biotin-dependent carboxyltransferase family protein [Maribacter hydrothermalis]APQ18673.1 allophanate hydrolase [Maribacter hydrothermalis]OBR40941.1 allophanate hydrolase [Maribacter hydrothermalis]